MNPSRLKAVLKTAFTSKKNVLIKGKPGIGKTEIVKQVADELKYDILISHPVISDPTDYKGLPGFDKDGRAHFLPFGDLIKLIEAKKPMISFYDDIGQSMLAVQGALMQVIQERKINGQKISEHVVFCGATNDTKDMAGVTGLIEPFKSRNTIVELETSVDDWCQWGFDNEMPSSLIAFIRFRPALLHKAKPTREIENSPSPRTWASVGRWMNAGMKDLDVFQGDVGEGPAAELMAFLDMEAKLPNLDSILMAPEKAEVPEEAACLFAISCGLAKKMTETNIGRALKYLDRLPKEYLVASIRDALHLNQKLANTPEFTKFAVANKALLT